MKKQFKKLLFIFMFSITVTMSAAPTKVAAAPTTKVYITKTGKKYHYKRCRTLKRSKKIIKANIKKSKKQGLTACKVCKPPKK